MNAKDPASVGWHLDRRVPIALIMTIFFQTVGAVWYAAGLAKDVGSNEKDIRKLETKVDQADSDRRNVSDRLIRVEEAVKRSNSLLEELVREQRRIRTKGQ